MLFEEINAATYLLIFNTLVRVTLFGEMEE